MKFIKYFLIIISVLGFIATVVNMIIDRAISDSNLRLIGIAGVVFGVAISLDKLIEKPTIKNE